MRIAFFTVRMLLGNGVDLVIHELARRLVADFGREVDVWTPTSDGTYDNENYSLNKLTVYGNQWNKALPILEFNAWLALRRLARSTGATGGGYDVVVPCAHPYYGAGRALGAPSVFFNFGNVPTTGFSWKGKLNWAWMDFSEAWLHKPYAAKVVSISHFLHDKQSRDIQQRGCVLHLAGDHYSSGEPAAQRRAFRARLGVGDDEVLLGYCGRLFRNHPEYKGTHKLLELGQRLHARDPRVKLVLCGIGDPPDAEWIAGEGAIPLLNHPVPEMPAFYDALDIYVCASRWEGFNLPIVEAAWHGVPSVAYDAGAHREHVTTVLVPDGDFDHLVAETAKLAGDAELRWELALKARKRAEQFSWDGVTAKFTEILAEIAV